MKKPLLTALLLLGSAAALAGPRSFVPGESGTTPDGRAYEKKYVNCSGRADQREVVFFEDVKKWCLPDESYCSRDLIRAAKKACKR
ncbi:MAG: hypothetical protein KatS3mg124_0983 [Porticoccaceae bacterium]|nr:MAG: hypothetical protein KatS3mg124_0983 [Porticoccaceae bacterium]